MPDGFIVADQTLDATDAARRAARAPARLRRADRRGPQVRDHRRLPPRPDRDARDHRRRRRRPGSATATSLDKPDALPAHRRVPRHRPPGVDLGRAPSTTRASSTRSTGAWSAVRPDGGHIPIYFGGASDDAIRVGGKHADVYAFWGEPLDGIRQRIAEVQAAAAAARPQPAGSPSACGRSSPTPRRRPGRGPTRSSSRTEERAADVRRRPRDSLAQAEGSQRLLGTPRRGDVHDKRLWTALAKATGARRQLDRPGRQLRAGRRVAARLRRRRRHHAADPRLRPARGRRRLRQPHPARPRKGRRRHPRLPGRRRGLSGRAASRAGPAAARRRVPRPGHSVPRAARHLLRFRPRPGRTRPRDLLRAPETLPLHSVPRMRRVVDGPCVGPLKYILSIDLIDIKESP